MKMCVRFIVFLVASNSASCEVEERWWQRGLGFIGEFVEGGRVCWGISRRLGPGGKTGITIWKRWNWWKRGKGRKDQVL